MTFSDRERFIYHAATLMTMQNLQVLSKSDLQKNLKSVQNNRCTSLTDKQIEEILLDVEKEVETCLSRVPKFNAKLKKAKELHKQGYKKREFAEDVQEDYK